jgi:hypothetical protein
MKEESEIAGKKRGTYTWKPSGSPIAPGSI